MLLPPCLPVEEKGYCQEQEQPYEVWDWVVTKLTPETESVIVALRWKDQHAIALLIHSTPRSKGGLSGAKKKIRSEWLTLTSLKFIRKGTLEEFLTHENDVVRNYFSLLAKKKVKIYTKEQFDVDPDQIETTSWRTSI